jgi:anti-sigma regulatory factor (Ser/Thr protein kinase)
MSSSTTSKRVIRVPALDEQGAAEELDSMITEALNSSPSKILLDCSLLEGATSIQVNTLWRVQQRCAEAGIKAKLISVGAGLTRVLRVLDLYDWMVAEGEKPLRELCLDPPAGGVTGPAALSLKFGTTVEEINRALREFRQYLSMQYIPEVACLELETVFYEVATNIRLHAGLRNGDYIDFQANRSGEIIVLEFRDPGQPFDPTKVAVKFDPSAAIRNRQKRGLGLIMIRRMVDSMRYECSDGLNVLRLTISTDRGAL